MSGSAVQFSALARFFRSRTQFAAIAVLSLCVLLAVGVQVYSSLNLSRVLNENWRGLYDLLVTAPHAELTTCQRGSDNLIAPNFVSYGSTASISLEQWQTVRALNGVAVAAPIGAVGQISPFAQEVYAAVPIDSDAGSVGYAITGTLSIDDGSASSVLSTKKLLVQIDPTASSWEDKVHTSAVGMSGDDTHALVSIATIPAIPTTLVAVDPTSERALLGHNGGFLDPLIAAQSIDTSTVERASAELAELAGRHLIEDRPEWQTYLILTPQDSPVMPIAINESAPQAINLTLQTETYTPIANATNQDLVRLATVGDLATASKGTETWDLSPALVPFRAETLNFEIPGLPPFPPPDALRSLWNAPGLHPISATPVELMPAGEDQGDECRLSAEAQGDYMQMLGAPGDFRSYHEQTYRSLTKLPEPEVPVAPVPVGSYSVSGVGLGSGDVSYVPLGAYESGETEILGQVEDPESAPVKGVLRPGISGLGITTGSAGALTTLEAARLIRGDTPIDAIRVRVAGVDRYDDAGRAKVAKVAEEIRALGLQVDVVAGSSREAVSIYVPDYTPTSGGEWEDLGWVRQQWSALDAAAKVQSSLDVGGLALLVYAVAGGTLLAGAASVLAGIARRRAVRTLRQMGWTGRQALVWVGGEYLVGAGVLALVSAGALGFAWWAGTLSPALGAVVGVVVVGYCAGGVLSALLAMREPGAVRRKAVHKDVHPVATAAAFGVKTAARTRGVTATTALTLTLIGVGAGVAAGAILTAISGAGATLLAGVAVSSLLPLHLGLALVGVCAGLVLAIVGRRADRPRRARALDALTGMGWEQRTVNVSLAAELGVTMLLALILAPAAVAVVSILAGYPLLVTVPLTIAGTVLAAGIILTTRTVRA